MKIRTGFPDIDGYAMHNRIDCHSPESIMIWFYRHDHSVNSMTDVYVYLLGASLDAAHVELNPFFPDIERYTIKKGEGKHTILIEFQNGEISFSYEEVFHRIRTKMLGRLPQRTRSVRQK